MDCLTSVSMGRRISRDYDQESYLRSGGQSCLLQSNRYYPAVAPERRPKFVFDYLYQQLHSDSSSRESRQLSQLACGLAVSEPCHCAQCRPLCCCRCCCCIYADDGVSMRNQGVVSDSRGWGVKEENVLDEVVKESVESCITVREATRPALDSVGKRTVDGDTVGWRYVQSGGAQNVITLVKVDCFEGPHPDSGMGSNTGQCPSPTARSQTPCALKSTTGVDVSQSKNGVGHTGRVATGLGVPMGLYRVYA